jgi:hypothetical protein
VRPSRFWPAAAAALATGLALPPGAAANGDPASDVLLVQGIYKPFEPLSAATSRDLDQVQAETAKAGKPIKIAVIAAPRDLGLVPQYFGKPQAYATFLAGELGALTSFAHPTPKGRKRPSEPLLVVMPAGFGLHGFPASARHALRAITPRRNDPPDALGRAAGLAVEKLSAATGHPIAPVVSRKESSGSGETLLVILLAAGALLLGVAGAVRLRGGR